MLLGREFRHLHQSDGVVQVDFDLFARMEFRVSPNTLSDYGAPNGKRGLISRRCIALPICTASARASSIF
jgi:hypothetical protein